MDIIKRYFLGKAIQGCTPKTAETYGHILRTFFDTTGRHVKDVVPDDIRVFMARKKIGGVSDSYLALIHRTLSSFFTWCASEDIIEKNPMARVEKVKVRKKVEAALDDEQLEMLRYIVKTKRNKAIVEFLYSTGCRVSEACSIKRSDINFDEGTIEVLGKGRKYRTVYLSKRCKFALQDYLNSRTDGLDALFVSDFSNAKGGLEAYQNQHVGVQPLQPAGMRDLFKAASRKCGFRVHPHLLRKTVATHALKRGMPIDQVKTMLGHESIATTTIYAQTQQEEVKHSHEKFV